MQWVTEHGSGETSVLKLAGRIFVSPQALPTRSFFFFVITFPFLGLPPDFFFSLLYALAICNHGLSIPQAFEQSSLFRLPLSPSSALRTVVPLPHFADRCPGPVVFSGPFPCVRSGQFIPLTDPGRRSHLTSALTSRLSSANCADLPFFRSLLVLHLLVRRVLSVSLASHNPEFWEPAAASAPPANRSRHFRTDHDFQHDGHRILLQANLVTKLAQNIVYFFLLASTMATNGSFAHQEQYKAATDPMAGAPGSIDAGAAAGTNNLSKDEVGWYFVEQYYTTLSKSPEKLHVRSGLSWSRQALHSPD